MAKRTLKPEVEPKPKRIRRPNPDIKFKLTTIEGRPVWKSLQGDTIVTLDLQDTLKGIMAFRSTGQPKRNVRLIFEPWED
jgi:hypothetical protein